MHRSQYQRLTKTRVGFARPTSAGFTLVELLVVITIISILASLITVVAFRAVVSAQKSSIVVEATRLEQAIQAHNDQFGFFPTETETPEGKAAFKKYLRRRFRNHRETDANIALIDLDPSETIIFFMGGLEDQRDSSGAITQVLGLKENQQYPLTGVGEPAGDLDLPEELLFDAEDSPDGYPSLRPRYGENTPFVFFGSDFYDNPTPLTYPTAFATGTQSNVGVAKPYLEKKVTTTAIDDVQFCNPEGFQIISAGLDAQFGGTATDINRVYPEGIPETVTYEGTSINSPGYFEDERDNVTNFAASSLEDKLP